MMTKHEKMTEFAEQLGREALSDPRLSGLHPCYAGWFLCFNREEYYEAHDVLEHLWLESEGNDYPFYKGLIQLAGGFVHLRLQYLHPDHRVHGRRLSPAVRLLRLAASNVSAVGSVYRGLDTDAVRQLSIHTADAIERAHGTNPWSPGAGPRLYPVASAA